MAEKKYTLKTLSEKTECPPYIIKYLYQCRKLPVVKESKGAGYKVYYAPEAVQIVLDHINRNK